MKRIIIAALCMFTLSAAAQTTTTNEIATKENVISDKQVKGMIVSRSVVDGSSITFIVLEPTTISGIPIKKGQMLRGKALIKDERLYADFSAVEIDKKLHQISGVKVFDHGGFEGIRIGKYNPNKPIDVSNTDVIFMIYN